MMQITFYLVLTLSLCAPFAICSEKQDPETGRDMIAKAVAKTNILALPAFEMKASVHIQEHGKDISGTYSLLWNGPDRWREEIQLPGYHETSVGGKGVVRLARNPDPGPEQIYYLRSALGFGPLGTSLTQAVRSDEKIKKVRDRHIKGNKALCVELEDPRKNERQICVDQSTGLVVRQDPITERDFVAVASKIYPRSISRKGHRGSGDSIEVTIQEINTKPSISPTQFEPSPNSSSRPGCLIPEPPRLVKKVPPSYPEVERAFRIQGRSVFSVWIASDGTFSDPVLVRSTTRGLAEASWDAIRQWRYDPATCEGTPVDQQIVVEINYALSH